MIRLTADDRRKSASWSKGNQDKWCQDGMWYKANYLGEEAITEHLVTLVLNASTLPAQTYVNYYPEVVFDTLLDRERLCSASKDFLHEGEHITTFWDILDGSGVNLRNSDSTIEKFNTVTDYVYKITDLDTRQYVRQFLLLDAITLDEDRHYNNLAVIYDIIKDKYRLCPLFDYGGALMSDTRMYYSVQQFNKVKAKPFSRDFDKQASLAGIEFTVDKAKLFQLLEENDYMYGLQVAVLKRLIGKYPQIYV